MNSDERSEGGDGSHPLANGTRELGRWTFTYDRAEEHGGGFTSGELLLRGDGVLFRRMGGDATSDEGTRYRFGPWERVDWWKPSTNLRQAKRALYREGYDLYGPTPVPIDETEAGPFPRVRRTDPPKRRRWWDRGR